MKEKIELRTVGERIGSDIWIKGEWTREEIENHPDREEILLEDDIIDKINIGHCRFIPDSREEFRGGWYEITERIGRGSFIITMLELRQRCHGGCYQKNEYGGHSYIPYPNEKCRKCNFIKSGGD